MENERKPGSVTFIFRSSTPKRVFNLVPNEGLALELDTHGNLLLHRDTEEGRAVDTIGRIPQSTRQRLEELFSKESAEVGDYFDCHMAAGFLAGQELTTAVPIPEGEEVSLDEAVTTFGVPCGMQLRRRHEEKPFHSAIILATSATPSTDVNTYAYHKPGRNDGEIVPLTLLLKRYGYDPVHHALTFYGLTKEERGDTER